LLEVRPGSSQVNPQDTGLVKIEGRFQIGGCPDQRIIDLYI